MSLDFKTDVKRSGVSFKYKIKTYGRYQDWFYFVPATPAGEEQMTEVFLRFSTTDVSVNTEVPLVDLDTFVSSVGGALGLFLGFSIIDTVLATYNYFNKSFDDIKK